MRWLAFAALATLILVAGWDAQPQTRPLAQPCCGEETTPPVTAPVTDPPTTETSPPTTETSPPTDPTSTGPMAPNPVTAPPPPGQVPDETGGGADRSPWTTVAYVGGGGALLALLGLLLVPLARRTPRRPETDGHARFLTGYPPPHITSRGLPGHPSVSVTLRLAVDPDRRRSP